MNEVRAAGLKSCKCSVLPHRLLPLIAILTLGHIAVSGGRVVATLFALKSGAGDGAAGLIIGLYAILPALFSLQFGRWIRPLRPASGQPGWASR